VGENHFIISGCDNPNYRRGFFLASTFSRRSANRRTKNRDEQGLQLLGFRRSKSSHRFKTTLYRSRVRPCRNRHPGNSNNLPYLQAGEIDEFLSTIFIKSL